jgi:hypothetical protein
MITLKEWMEVVNYRITEGGNYGWDCYGSDAYTLDSWNGEQAGHSLSIVFDQKSQEVYEVQIHDYRNNRAYRMINPAYKEAFEEEAKSKNSWMVEAWENVDYIDLESDDDWIQKGIAVVAEEEYDTRVSIPIDLPETELMTLFKAAHEADMTFNDFVEQILREKLADEGFVNLLKEKKAAHDIAG